MKRLNMSIIGLMAVSLALFFLIVGCAGPGEQRDAREYREHVAFNDLAAKCVQRGGRLVTPPSTGSRVNGRISRQAMRDARCLR